MKVYICLLLFGTLSFLISTPLKRNRAFYYLPTPIVFTVLFVPATSLPTNHACNADVIIVCSGLPTKYFCRNVFKIPPSLSLFSVILLLPALLSLRYCISEYSHWGWAHKMQHTRFLSWSFLWSLLSWIILTFLSYSIQNLHTVLYLPKILVHLWGYSPW